MPSCKLSGGTRQFRNLKELREHRDATAEEMTKLGEAFEGRKTKRDAGEDVALWGEGEEARFNALDSDVQALDAAIAEEERANQIAARSKAVRDSRANRPPGGGPPAENDGGTDDEPEGDYTRRIRVPARCRPLGRLIGFRDARDAYAAGRWARGVLFGHEQDRQWCNEHLPEENRAMGGTSFGKGGFLVPSAMLTAVIDLVEQYGIALADCEVVRMPAETLDWPRVTGGVTFYAVGENTEITESTPTGDSVNLTARKFGALVKYPSELEEDAVIDLAQMIVRKVAWGWAKKLDECLFLGDGTSTYHHIKGIKVALQDGSEATALTGNTAFSTLDMVDFESMIGKLASWAEANAKWYISKAGWAASMMRLADAAGGNTSDNVARGPQRSFLGYPVRFAVPMNNTLTAQTSTEGLAYLGDLMNGVVVGLRRELRLAVARERYIEYDQVGVVATVRFDINVHDTGGSSTAGGIIGLETPSS